MANARLPKTALLRKSREYDNVYKKGRRLYGRGFVLICLANTDGVNRLGVSVHRGIRGAVKRNRIKRIIRESFRLGRSLYPRGMDMVFAVRRGFACSHPGDVSDAVASLTCDFSCCRKT